MEIAINTQNSIDALSILASQAKNHFSEITDNSSIIEREKVLKSYRAKHTILVDTRKKITEPLDEIKAKLMSFEKELDPKKNAEYLSQEEKYNELRAYEESKIKVIATFQNDIFTRFQLYQEAVKERVFDLYAKALQIGAYNKDSILKQLSFVPYPPQIEINQHGIKEQEFESIKIEFDITQNIDIEAIFSSVFNNFDEDKTKKVSEIEEPKIKVTDTEAPFVPVVQNIGFKKLKEFIVIPTPADIEYAITALKIAIKYPIQQYINNKSTETITIKQFLEALAKYCAENNIDPKTAMGIDYYIQKK